MARHHTHQPRNSTPPPTSSPKQQPDQCNSTQIKKSSKKSELLAQFTNQEKSFSAIRKQPKTAKNIASDHWKRWIFLPVAVFQKIPAIFKLLIGIQANIKMRKQLSFFTALFKAKPSP
jgi:hypothetical protein